MLIFLGDGVKNRPRRIIRQCLGQKKKIRENAREVNSKKSYRRNYEF
jgi:hypothetical protein